MPKKGYRQSPEHIAKRGLPPSVQVEIACVVCGATRTVPRYYAGRYKTCGAADCRRQALSVGGKSNRGRVRSEETRTKISATTRGKPHSPEHIAAITEARLKSGWFKDPVATGEKISAAQTGQKRPQRNGAGNPMWRGGLTVLNKSNRATSEYATWRLAVLDRDGWTCQMCGTDLNVVAHHILSWHDYKRYRADVNNGIALCRSCHAIAHGFTQQYRHR